MESTIHIQILLCGFAIAVVLGAVAHKTHFCTLGAVSDWVNIGDNGRLCAWFLAIAVAVAGVTLLEGSGLVAFDATRPPYRNAGFAWPRYLLGGLMFGVGMSLAGGCGTKNLIRLGGGNLKSLCVVVTIGVFAYLMTKTDFYAIFFHSWLQPLTIDLDQFNINAQDIGSLLTALFTIDLMTARLLCGTVLSTLLVILILCSHDFRNSADNALGGITVGLCILGGWYLTGGSLGQAWQEEVAWMDVPPLGVGVQSYTFVNPMGEGLAYLAQPTNVQLLTFGTLAVAGVLVGSFIYALFSRRLQLEWFVSWADFFRHVGGAALMGIGGVLAMGCTIGQGITGVSTLALGSFVALGTIILGSATTLKVMYYKMLYEDASVFDAVLSGWADLHLLPQSLRRLEAL